ncbi:uracil-xanthine permease family protein [Calditerrivibrio sp.]|uniref:Uracil permease n=1 Tax=Calditerrivibrio nitroreducens TaxID=477976 RepID=A0A2J6WPZ3_9BACT|nr:MAG: uracil permease [Calditerrivibrio nitroreducens]
MHNSIGINRILLGVQFLFVAFGALVLVPLLTGLDPSIALFTAGAGTLLFQLITKSKVPVFLASSFAFIAPIQYSMKNFGVGETFGGLVASGLAYLLFSFLVYKGGVRAIERYLPPVVTGPVIMVIGLNLAPVAIKMAKSFDGSGNFNGKAMIISTVSLVTAIIVVMYGRRLLSLIPILMGIIVGYLFSLIMGVVDLSPIANAKWLVVPWLEAIKNGSYALPVFDLNAILFILPVAIAPAIEHVGDILAISSVTGKNYLEDPGLHKTLLGDGLATSFASLLGGPPNTTYSEVTGAVALTKATDVVYMRIASFTAILLAFMGKLNAVLKTIPVPVMGGILILLFGMIAAIGVGTLVRNKVDMAKARNLVIVSVVLVIGIGNLVLSVGPITLGGIGLAGLVGVILNFVLPEGR